MKQKRNRRSGLTDKEAQQLLKKLTQHFGEPVRPVREYCKALETWASCIIELNDGGDQHAQGSDYAKSLGSILIDIRKSNLLARLIYDGQKLRTEKCPIHQGKWSGCLQGCVYGCDQTGWLMLPEMVEKWLKRVRKITGLTDQDIIARAEAKNFTRLEYASDKDKGRYSLSEKLIFQWLYHIGKVDLIPPEHLAKMPH